MKKEKKKNSKKEIKVLFIILLLVMAICGSIGYGVYSYYWARGEFSMDASTTVIGKFGAYVNTSGGETETFDTLYYDFVAGNNTGNALLECPYSLEFDSTNTCNAFARFYNDGDTDVRINLTDFTTTINNPNDGVAWTASNVRASNTDFVLAPGEYYNVNIEVDLTNDNSSSSESSGSAEEVTESVYEEKEVALSVDFNISATQVVD